jgi:Flp pilus assembly protein TadD
VPDLVRALEALGDALKRAGRDDEGRQRLARAAELKSRQRNKAT